MIPIGENKRRTGKCRTQETYTEHEPGKARNPYPKREVEAERSRETNNIKKEYTQKDNRQRE